MLFEKCSETSNVVESVVSETTNVVENVVEESANGAEEIAGKVVGGIVNNLVKPNKTPVSFVVDVESKAIVESVAEALDNFTVDKLNDSFTKTYFSCRKL